MSKELAKLDKNHLECQHKFPMLYRKGNEFGIKCRDCGKLQTKKRVKI